jgi:molecular chaperone DnaK
MKKYAIGIDLGTTYSALATLNSSGKPEIVPNLDGERVTASAVYFQQEGPILVGQLAVDAAAGDPDRVIQHVKRRMGDPEWRVEQDGNSYSAVDISAMILKKVKKDSESTLGQIEHAVITVPAYFDEYRRKATMDAAEKAGLKVLRIINEPTAAALTYAKTGQCKGKVLIYDLGGGTFDVSIVDIQSPQEITVIASEGDHDLGGVNFDEALAEHLNELFYKEKGVYLKTEEDSAPFRRSQAEAERAKRKLSKIEQVSPIPLNFGEHWMNASVKRTDFEALISDYITKTEMLIEDALFEANLKENDIEYVLLVGGSTRIPAIKKMLHKKFGKEPLSQVNPDEAVALGAAIQAGMLMHDQGMIELTEDAAIALRNTRLQDVTNHSFGVIYLDNQHGAETLRNSIIIPKNTAIPKSATKSLYTIRQGQTQVHCEITQGEDEDPKFVNIIADGLLDLPPNRPVGMEIKVTYSYDANGRMSCEFLDVESGNRKKFDLDTASRAMKSGDQDDIDEAAFNDLEIE